MTSFDTGIPHSARRYDYWLGGKDNFAADRASGDAIAEIWPSIRVTARENRAFLRRAVRYLADRHGVRQFLDIGTGLPTAENTHEVAQSVAPRSRIVYVDNDPLVLVHARALLTSSDEGATAYLDADLRDPEDILRQAAATLDFGQPVAVILAYILHFLPDADDPAAIVETLTAKLAPGSFLVLSHGSYDLMDPKTADELAGRNFDFHARTREQVLTFFHGLELVAPDPTAPDRDELTPELGLISDWGRTAGEQRPAPADVSAWGAVGRKP